MQRLVPDAEAGVAYPAMKTIACAFFLAFWLSAPALAQEMDPALRGVWKLNVNQSTFADGSKAKAGRINWTEHGWVFAIMTGDGYLYADGVITDHGCAMIGVSSDYSCELKIITPKHVRFTLRHAGAVERVGDIELLDKNTTQATHHVTPGDGKPYVEKTIWERE
jgi:hypothetical protein